MTDEQYDSQTLATSARIERLHRLRFGPQARTWVCERGHVNRDSQHGRCLYWNCVRAAIHAGDGIRRTFPMYGLSDTEELIYSRAN